MSFRIAARRCAARTCSVAARESGGYQTIAVESVGRSRDTSNAANSPRGQLVERGPRDRVEAEAGHNLVGVLVGAEVLAVMPWSQMHDQRALVVAVDCARQGQPQRAVKGLDAAAVGVEPGQKVAARADVDDLVTVDEKVDAS